MLRFILILLIFLPVPAFAAPKVVATIAPLAGIAAAVMGDVAAPGLLIKNNASPHTYQLKPSDAVLLGAADVVLWVGEGMESMLAGKLTTLSPQADVLGLMDEDAGMMHLPSRNENVWETEADEHEHHHAHDHGHDDPHAWLDPQNALVLAERLAALLVRKDPANAAAYVANLTGFKADMQQLDAELKELLAPVRSRRFVVFHDAYQYFERHYGLNAIGAVSLSPDVPPSPQRMADLQKRIVSENAVCVFAEPQFSPALIDTLLAGTSAQRGVLNADASDLPVNPGLYVAYLRRLAAAFRECLG